MKYTVLLMLLLSGCSSVPPKPEKIELSQFKPEKPSAIQTYEVHWKVDDTGNVYLSSKDGVKVNAERKDTIRYIKEVQNLVCYYEDSYSFCSTNK